MELILNLLTLKEKQRDAFVRAAEGYEQIFAPNGALEDGRPVPSELYRRAAVILGNPPIKELAVCENLRLLQTRSAGMDQYQRPGVLPEGVTLLNASGAYGHSVSEHMFAMLFSLMKRLPSYRDQQRAGIWNDLGPVKTLAGAQVLCVGTGDLGSSFARLCKALGARTAGVRRDARKPAEGIDEMYPMDRLDELLPQADVVALTLPHSADTVHLMDRRRLLLMKRDAILLNGGRGTAVDCAALAQVLEDGHLWGACLDVTDPEPLPAGHPLWAQERAVLTPHTAGTDHLADTMDRVAAIALEHLIIFLAGDRRGKQSASKPVVEASAAEKILMILEVSRKQDYIFASRKLRENAARSGDIAYVTSSEFFGEPGVAAEWYREEENLVYSGGGHTVLQFDGRERATAFAKRVTEAVLRRYEGLEVFVRQMPYDSAKTPGENLKALSAGLERKKSVRRSGFRQLSFGVEALDRENYLPVSLGEGPVRRPRQSGRLERSAGWDFPAEFDKLAGGDNFIAVVHIDGNAMGKRVDRVYERFGRDWESCRAGLRRFSEAIQRDYEDAFLEMAGEVSRQFPKFAPPPVRPVILAGDDVCFVCAGNIGLECARIFLERLSAKTNSEDQENYSACAGVALVHAKSPFHRAYDLAEELCSSAKRFSAALDPDGRVSAMDWHIEFGQMKYNLEELREDYACEDGGRMELRPVAVTVPDGCDPGVRAYGFFKALCLAIGSERGGIARSKIKQLRQAFKQGELESQYFLHDKQIGELLCRPFEDGDRVPDRRWACYRDVLRGGKAFREVDGVRRCLFFDAVEMVDHFTAFKEMEA